MGTYKQEKMKAFISDIHGNLEALQETLGFLDSLGIEEVYCLGDLVGYGPDPGPCITLICERCRGVVAGNHDWAVAGIFSVSGFSPEAREAILWTRERLNAEEIRYLSALPLSISLSEAFLVHSSPLDPARWSYILGTEDAVSALRYSPSDLCMVGHTHVPAVFCEEDARLGHCFPLVMEGKGRCLVNVGSVGQPRDGDPRAACVLLEGGRLTLERIPYPVEVTSGKILERGLPEFLARRLGKGV
jgi:diadenosine tetraphosphatase ApaH/serine/threonine PP2A family protein phosphatase